MDCNERHRYLLLVYTNSNVKIELDWWFSSIAMHWYATKLEVNHHQPSGLLLYSPWHHKKYIIKSTAVHYAGAQYIKLY